MLNKIIISNINSIGECEIDFSKSKYKYLENNILDENVNPIAIYGHNGSGKTSLVKCIGSLLTLLTGDPDELSSFPVNIYNVDKCFFNKENNNISNLKSSLSLRFDINDKKYEYFISTLIGTGIVREYLRSENEYTFDRSVKKVNYLSNSFDIDNDEKNFPTLRKLFFDAENDLDIKNVYTYLSNFAYLDMPNKKYSIKSLRTKSINDLLVNKSNEVKEIIKGYNEFPVYSIKEKTNDIKKDTISMNLTKKYYLELESEGDVIDLPLELISSGMMNQSILLSTLLSIPKNGVFFVDELDLALHPSTIKSFLEVVKKRKIQLVFTSHNTNILQSLRPDQIYFAHWNKGFSSYSRLSDIYENIREINNIEKMYLSSVFDEGIKNDKKIFINR